MPVAISFPTGVRHASDHQGNLSDTIDHFRVAMEPIDSTSEEFMAKAPILDPKTQNHRCSSPKICIGCNLHPCSRFFIDQFWFIGV
uniref:Uncharacterized protein n=1 Tax=Manihot esculenta TaxID=3983 RepID=A0A199UC66_MANES